MANDDILDPICDMVVSVTAQRAKGLATTYAGREYAFCGPGCRRAFEKDPAKYAGKVDAWLKR